MKKWWEIEFYYLFYDFWLTATTIKKKTTTSLGIVFCLQLSVAYRYKLNFHLIPTYNWHSPPPTLVVRSMYAFFLLFFFFLVFLKIAFIFSIAGQLNTRGPNKLQPAFNTFGTSRKCMGRKDKKKSQFVRGLLRIPVYVNPRNYREKKPK